MASRRDFLSGFASASFVPFLNAPDRTAGSIDYNGQAIIGVKEIQFSDGSIQSTAYQQTETTDDGSFTDALTIGQSVAQCGIDDSVVVVAEGHGANPAGVFPLDSSAAPVSDAYDYMAAETLTGTVILPPTSVSDNDLSAVTNFADVIDMIGHGIGVSQIIPANGEELLISPSGQTANCKWDRFGINDTGVTRTSGSAIKFTGNAKQFDIGSLGIGWSADEAIDYDTGHPFAGRWDSLEIEMRDANSAFRIDDAGAPHSYGDLYFTMSGGAEVFAAPSLQAFSGSFESIGVGGSPGRLWRVRNAGAAGGVRFGLINFEPDASTTIGEVLRLDELGYVEIGQLIAQAPVADLTVDRIINLGPDNGNNHIRNIQVGANVTVNNNVIKATNAVGTATTPSYYYGPAGDVTDVNGGAVRAMNTAGTSS